MTRLAGTAIRRVLLAAALLGAGAPATAGQELGTLRAEENFRLAPNGEILARLQPAATLSVVSTRGDWHEVDLVGWVWMRSLQVRDESNWDLIVSEPEGENLRSEPQGTVLGRLERGTLLEELARQPGWIQVRRRGFVWARSVDIANVAPATPPSASEEPTSRPVRPTPTESTPAATRPGGFAVAGTGGVAILTSPDGDTLAHTVPRTELQVTSREGNWVRIRLEGWAWMPDLPARAEEAGAPVLTPEDLALDPDAHVGRVVSWRLQFVSLERAEKVRTDFREGEPFLLCRFGGAEGPFVYVAVPTERVADVQGLLPLEYLNVTGRVRTGASVLTGTPVVDMLSFQRDRTRR